MSSDSNEKIYLEYFGSNEGFASLEYLLPSLTLIVRNRSRGIEFIQLWIRNSEDPVGEIETYFEKLFSKFDGETDTNIIDGLYMSIDMVAKKLLFSWPEYSDLDEDLTCKHMEQKLYVNINSYFDDYYAFPKELLLEYLNRIEVKVEQ